ncbi:tail tube [Aeromonas phage GomatiRiver_11]|nr:tail tube protein [Aeromonas phage AhFM11]WBF04172.1 tail tube [Aeromonas phage GomatiRiver_11]
MDVTDVLRAFESGDFARPNLFEIEIPFLGQNFKFKAKAGTMPAATVEKVPVGYMNRKLNIAGDRIFDDWTITVYNDSAHDTRQAIVDWNAMGAGMGNAITGDVPEAYKKPGIVRQKDRNGEDTKEYTIVGLFPTNVGEVTLDWDDNNTVSTFEVTFMLDWWE